MAGSINEKWSIDKLNDLNWITWKFQIRHMLLAKGFWGHVDGTDELADDATDQVQREFRRKGQKAILLDHHGY